MYSAGIASNVNSPDMCAMCLCMKCVYGPRKPDPKYQCPIGSCMCCPGGYTQCNQYKPLN